MCVPIIYLQSIRISFLYANVFHLFKHLFRPRVCSTLSQPSAKFLRISRDKDDLLGGANTWNSTESELVRDNVTLFQVDFQKSFFFLTAYVKAVKWSFFFTTVTFQWIEWSDCEKTLEKHILNNMEPLKQKQLLCHQYLTSIRQQWRKIKMTSVLLLSSWDLC